MAKEKKSAEAKAGDRATINVVAIRKGYHGLIFRRPGDKFRLEPIKMSNGKIQTAEEQFSALWMKRVGEGPDVEAKEAPLVPQTKALGAAGESGSLPDLPESAHDSDDEEI